MRCARSTGRCGRPATLQGSPRTKVGGSVIAALAELGFLIFGGESERLQQEATKPWDSRDEGGWAGGCCGWVVGLFWGGVGRCSWSGGGVVKGCTNGWVLQGCSMGLGAAGCSTAPRALKMQRRRAPASVMPTSAHHTLSLETLRPGPEISRLLDSNASLRDEVSALRTLAESMRASHTSPLGEPRRTCRLPVRCMPAYAGDISQCNLYNNVPCTRCARTASVYALLCMSAPAPCPLFSQRRHPLLAASPAASAPAAAARRSEDSLQLNGSRHFSHLERSISISTSASRLGEGGGQQRRTGSEAVDLDSMLAAENGGWAGAWVGGRFVFRGVVVGWLGGCEAVDLDSMLAAENGGWVGGWGVFRVLWLLVGWSMRGHIGGVAVGVDRS